MQSEFNARCLFNVLTFCAGDSIPEPFEPLEIGFYQIEVYNSSNEMVYGANHIGDAEVICSVVSGDPVGTKMNQRNTKSLTALRQPLGPMPLTRFNFGTVRAAQRFFGI